MRVLFLARATLFKTYGGDTVQIVSTAKYLRKLGVQVDIKLTNEKIDYTRYDLLHIYNVIRPADALYHIKRSGKPYVVSTIFLDYDEFQKQNASGLRRLAGKVFDSDQLEYIKAMARWIKKGEVVRSKEYLYLGHKNAVKKVALKAAYLLPNSYNEYERFSAKYNVRKSYKVIYNGIDYDIFNVRPSIYKKLHDPKQVISVARIEGHKNQLNLIKALNNTEFNLKIIGRPAPNHVKYYKECKRVASDNIHFIEQFLPQDQLSSYYMGAKVHVLPSWNETCGLSSLEAAYMGCNIVITDKGDTTEYFGDNAWYCDPASPESIYEAIKQAAEAPFNEKIREQVIEVFNWEEAAINTYNVYKAVLNKNHVTAHPN